jgi:hypothetical protein
MTHVALVARSGGSSRTSLDTRSLLRLVCGGARFTAEVVGLRTVTVSRLRVALLGRRLASGVRH